MVVSWMGPVECAERCRYEYIFIKEVQGYEIKKGKLISFRAPGQERFTRECCNYCDGNCLLLDDGEEYVCVQSISCSLLCRWIFSKR